MPRNRLTLAVAVLVIVVLLLQLVAFRVRETERVVVKRLGEATRAVKEPGLYWKWPWPIEEVVRQDARLRVLEGPLEEMVTEDRKSVLVSCFVTWRPGDSLRFLERHESAEAAERALERLLRSKQSEALGRFPFGTLIAQDRSQLRWDQLEDAIRTPLEKKSAEELGIEVVFVGIRRIALPKETTENVFARMKAERDEKAKAYLAEGQAEADKIRDRAENERNQAVDRAHAEARTLLAAAERESEDAHRALEVDPELAIFLRKVEALKRGLAGRTTIVYDMGSWPFDLLVPGAIAPVTSGGKK